MKSFLLAVVIFLVGSAVAPAQSVQDPAAVPDYPTLMIMPLTQASYNTVVAGMTKVNPSYVTDATHGHYIGSAGEFWWFYDPPNADNTKGSGDAVYGNFVVTVVSVPATMATYTYDQVQTYFTTTIQTFVGGTP